MLVRVSRPANESRARVRTAVRRRSRDSNETHEQSEKNTCRDVREKIKAPKIKALLYLRACVCMRKSVTTAVNVKTFSLTLCNLRPASKRSPTVVDRKGGDRRVSPLRNATPPPPRVKRQHAATTAVCEKRAILHPFVRGNPQDVCLCTNLTQTQFDSNSNAPPSA